MPLIMSQKYMDVKSFYYCYTLNFKILQAFVLQLDLTGLTAQEIGTTARQYSNKTSLHISLRGVQLLHIK